jgi:orotate phosphoribosyltransferase
MEKFHTPSGRTLFADDLDLLHRLEHIGTIAWGDEVTFNSGFRSRVYIRARNELSHDPELLLEVAARIKSQVEELPITHGPQLCLIGIPTAGTQLAQAVSHLSMSEHLDLGAGSELEHPICFSTM